MISFTRDGTHDQPTALSLSAMISQYFMGGTMPESAITMHRPETIIEIRPFRGGWQCFERPGVQPCSRRPAGLFPPAPMIKILQ